MNTISEVSENVKRMDELLEGYKKQELPKSDHETLQVGVPFSFMRGSFGCGWEGLGQWDSIGSKPHSISTREERYHGRNNFSVPGE